jgi:hypothetical protein
VSERQRTACLVDSARFFLFHPEDFSEDEAGELDPPDRAFDEGRDEYDWPREPHVALRRGKYRAELFLLTSDATTAKNTSFFLSLERTDSFDAIPAWREFPREDDRGGEAPVLPPKALRRVRHAKFGEGDVIRDEPPNVVVRFADGAERKLLAKFVSPVTE